MHSRVPRVLTRYSVIRTQVWLVDAYPLSRDQLLDVLRSLRGASSIADKVIDFLELDLPAGFPIRMGTKAVQRPTAAAVHRTHVRHVAWGATQRSRCSPGSRLS